MIDRTFLFLFDEHHREKLIRCDVAERKADAEPEGSTKINSTAQELASLGVLQSIQPVERTRFATAPVVSGIRA